MAFGRCLKSVRGQVCAAEIDARGVTHVRYGPQRGAGETVSGRAQGKRPVAISQRPVHPVARDKVFDFRDGLGPVADDAIPLPPCVAGWC